MCALYLVRYGAAILARVFCRITAPLCSRAYAGTLTYSDHRLVKTTFRAEKHKRWNTKSNTPKPPKLNISKLTNSKTCRDQYRIELNYRLTQIDQDNDTVCNTWTAIKNSAKASVRNKNEHRTTPFQNYQRDKKISGYKFKTRITERERWN